MTQPAQTMDVNYLQFFQGLVKALQQKQGHPTAGSSVSKTTNAKKPTYGYCFTCQAPDHYSPACPQRQKKDQTQQTEDTIPRSDSKTVANLVPAKIVNNADVCKEKKKFTFVCYFCGEANSHFAKDCPRKLAQLYDEEK